MNRAGMTFVAGAIFSLGAVAAQAKTGAQASAQSGTQASVQAGQTQAQASGNASASTSASAQNGQANGSLATVLGVLQGADVAPTTQALAAVNQARRDVVTVMAKWGEVKSGDLTRLNAQLRQADLPPLDPASWKQARVDMGDENTMADEEEEP